MMTDNEIVKALECCMGCACKGCPYDGDAKIEADVCINELVIDSLKLINRQKEEIDRLQCEIKEKTETIVFLKDQAVGWSIDFCNIKNKVKTAKTEAIKEFGAKFAETAVYLYITRKYEINEDDLNRIAKELTEENSNGE